ncbi:MAG: hypothetical protein ABIG31_04375 [Candidatus Omnitrophota bacterium]
MGKKLITEKAEKKPQKTCYARLNSDIWTVGTASGGFLAAALLSISPAGSSSCNSAGDAK